MKAIQLLRYAVLTLGVGAFALPGLPAAQMGHILSVVQAQEKQWEEHAAQNLRDFKLIKTVQTFPDRINATYAVDIDSDPDGAIAALHDMNTGEALESCKTPCQLHIRKGLTYLGVIYKFGHQPTPFPISDEFPPSKAWLGINYLDVLNKQRQCWKDFEAGFQDDGDAAPCVRVPPIMPPMAKKSGHCKMLFDVTPKGRPENIKTTFCTQSYFAQPSIESVRWWFYHPKAERGQTVTRKNVTTKISFRLSDADGNIIPE